MCFQHCQHESEAFAAFAPIVGMMLWTHCSRDGQFGKHIRILNGTIDDVTLYNGDLDNTGGWGPYHSIPDTMALWRSILGTTDSESVFLPNLDPGDGSIVQLETNRSVDAEALLQYYLVIGGGMTGRANLATGTSARLCRCGTSSTTSRLALVFLPMRTTTT